jgi:hypothetical protein
VRRLPGRRQHRAGESALAVWRAERRRTLLSNWRDTASLVAIVTGSGVAIPFTSGVTQLLAAGVLGGASMLASMIWLMGGDAHSLPWLWGRAGEQQTESALTVLAGGWHVEHDLPRARGNWDHAVVGPGGVFLLETKHYRARALVAGDTLYLGRRPFRGGGLRFAAKELGAALQPFDARRPWVQPVVVVWGEFPQRRHEENGVVYLAGPELVDWLREQPTTLAASRCDEVGRALRHVRESATARAPEPVTASA